MRRSFLYAALSTALLSLSLAACGGDKDGAKAEDKLQLTTESDNQSAPFAPCDLLTHDQVASVLTDSDNGFVAKDGGSLIDGVDTYQCSYSNPAGDLFTVVVHMAVDKSRFERIKPNASTLHMVHTDAKDVAVGDGGWMLGESNDMRLKAIKGFSLIELELQTSDAGAKSDALIAVAKAIAEKL